MLFSNSIVRGMIQRLVIHFCFLFQMVGNLQTILFFLYTFVLPVDLIDPGKKVFDKFVYF